MKVRELINELEKYDDNLRVVLCSHGRCGIEEQNEILGCYKEECFDEDDELMETVVTLYEY